MLLGNKTFLFTDSNSINDFDWNGSDSLVAVTASKAIRIDLANQKRLADSALTNGGHSVSFVDSTHAAIMSFNVTTPYYLNFTTGGVSVLASTQFSKLQQKHNMQARDTDNNKAMGIGFTTPHLVLFDTTPAQTDLNPAGLSGKIPTAIIYKPGSSTWLVGTSVGSIYTVTAGGVATPYLTLPNSPSTGTGPNNEITSMALDGDNLFVGTTDGLVFHYIYSTVTLKSIAQLASPAISSTVGTCLSNVVNGLMCVGSQVGSAPYGTSLYDVGVLPISQMDAVISNGDLGIHMGSILDDVQKQVILVFDKGIIGYDAPWLASTTIPTRAQDPLGTDVAHRLMRMHKNAVGQYKMELDANQSSGEQSVAARFPGDEYLDLSLIGTQFATEKFGIGRAEA